jgi:hypothetical protein
MVADFHDGLPYVCEFAFAKTDNPLLRGMHIGLNWVGIEHGRAPL